MRLIIPPPLTNPPEPQSFLRDFMLLLKNQIRVFWNTVRQRPMRTFLGVFFILLITVILLSSLGSFAYAALTSMSPEIAQGFLSLLFMVGLTSQLFFGITAAFSALYMSDDLELLFMTPVPLKAVFAVKSLSVLVSNFLIAFLFVFLPGIFFGLLFQAGAAFYLLAVLIGIGLLIMGTAASEIINLLIMRIVPPHRSKEAIGFIGAFTGILMALLFQLPNMMLNNQENMDVSGWLTGQSQVLSVMKYFPWGWSAQALSKAITGNMAAGIGWSLLLLFVGFLLFILSFVLLERGFRQGFISLSQGEGGRRRKRKTVGDNSNQKPLQANELKFYGERTSHKASPLAGMWAVAKKDLLYIKRDSREWFGYLAPLIVMAFFIVQALLSSSAASRSSLMTVLIMYTIMFSGNLALQSFGREGESEWLLNSVPLAGWPIVWGKLISSVLPTLILMESLLVGTALFMGMSVSMLILLGLAAVFISLGSSAMGLYYSINNCRYNPDKPQSRISPGASLIMYLVNLAFILILALGFSYLFPPTELSSLLKDLPPVTFEGGFFSAILYGLYLLSRPFLWPTALRTLLGIFVTFGVWSIIFFGFLAATVRQSRKGLRVEVISSTKSSKSLSSGKKLRRKIR